MPTLQDPDILYICFCKQLTNVILIIYFVIIFLISLDICPLLHMYLANILPNVACFFHFYTISYLKASEVFSFLGMSFKG